MRELVLVHVWVRVCLCKVKGWSMLGLVHVWVRVCLGKVKGWSMFGLVHVWVRFSPCVGVNFS